MSQDGTRHPVVPSGYRTTQDFWSARYSQGQRPTYVFDLSLAEVVGTIPRPDDKLDPDEALKQGNRQINLSHAQGFADYVRSREHWVSSALLLRAAAGVFRFEPDPAIGSVVPGVSWGVLSIPKLSMSDLRILDGQHRILGLHLAWEQIAGDLQGARESLERAKRNGDPAGVRKLFEDDIQRCLDQRSKFGDERITIQVVEVTDRADYLQVFADIADNAKGIGGALRTTFDTAKKLNRCVEPVMAHPLLNGRVDQHTDRVTGSSSKLMSARHVADIVKMVAKGGGYWTPRDEADLSEPELIRNTELFLDALVQAYPQLAAISEGRLSPADLRDTSLLGSVTFVHALARAYHDLLEGGSKLDRSAMNREDVIEGLRTLPVESPIDHSGDGFWMPCGVFQEPWRAPLARGGNRKALTDFIVAKIAKPAAD